MVEEEPLPLDVPPRPRRARKEEEFEPTLRDGTPLKDAVSALIKELRRGHELEAHWWVKQLEESGFWRYAWRRLLIACSEEIGVANPVAVVAVRALYENYTTMQKESRAPRPDESILAMAVQLVCQSPKSRAADDLLNVHRVLAGRWGWKPGIPSYAVDLHTKEGRRQPRVEQLRQWFDESSVVEPDVGPKDWRLWLERQANREWGYASAEEIEERAERWDAEGRLLWGMAGWFPRSWEYDRLIEDAAVEERP